MSQKWWYKNWTRREVQLVDLPWKPTAGHATSLATRGKEILYIWGFRREGGSFSGPPFPPCVGPDDGSPVNPLLIMHPIWGSGLAGTVSPNM